MSASDISICSNALLMLGAQPINSLDEDLDRARIAANLYPNVRDDVLRSHPWNCAIKRVILSPEATAPLYDFPYQFRLPADWLRTLQVGENYPGYGQDYLCEGRMILTHEPHLKLRYLFRNDDVSTWDSMLVHVMTLAMAARMAYAITQSAALEQTRLQELQMALKAARSVDGQDDPPQTLGGSPLLLSRFGGSSWRG